MKAMVLERPAAGVLRLVEIPVPAPGPGEVLVEVSACAVCRTDLHVVDGELPHPKLPLVPGHQIVGRVRAAGAGVSGIEMGARVGIPWLGWTCASCGPCLRGDENLCDRAIFTGYGRDGGYAEAVVADARYAFPIPEGYDDLQAAPLLCGGLIGYRALRLAGGGGTLGFYGFGSAAHMLAQVVRHQGRRLLAFTRPGDAAAQDLARRLGAAWAGSSDEPAPEPLDAAIIFAPDGRLVPRALASVRKGGIVVCAGIHMSDIPSFPYRILWEERVVRSVANLTRRDATEMLELAPRIGVRTEVKVFPLEEANEALAALREGRITGTAVLQVEV